MEPMRIAQVLEYMRCDDDDDRAIQCIEQPKDT